MIPPGELDLKWIRGPEAEGERRWLAGVGIKAYNHATDLEWIFTDQILGEYPDRVCTKKQVALLEDIRTLAMDLYRAGSFDWEVSCPQCGGVVKMHGVSFPNRICCTQCNRAATVVPKMESAAYENL